jgi:hypothetical protein
MKLVGVLILSYCICSSAFAESDRCETSIKQIKVPFSTKKAGEFFFQSYRNNKLVVWHVPTGWMATLQNEHTTLSGVGKIEVSADQTRIASHVFDGVIGAPGDHGGTTVGFGLQLYATRGNYVERVGLRFFNKSDFYEESVSDVFLFSPKGAPIDLLAISVQTSGYGKDGPISGSRVVFFKMDGERYWTYNEPTGQPIKEFEFVDDGKKLVIPKLNSGGSIIGIRTLDVENKNELRGPNETRLPH